MLLIICDKIDSPCDVEEKFADMKGQLWAIGPEMLRSHLVREVLGKFALASKVLTMLVDEAHTIKDWGQS